MNKHIWFAAAGAFATLSFAAPALAMSTAGQVPACSSSTAAKELKDGDYAGYLQKPGLTIDSLELWNGCVKVIYSNASGNATTAFYDPDTLQLVQSSGPAGNLG